MTRPSDTQEHTTGELCPGCESEVLIVVDAAEELRLQCDCGDTLALGPGSPTFAHAA